LVCAGLLQQGSVICCKQEGLHPNPEIALSVHREVCMRFNQPHQPAPPRYSGRVVGSGNIAGQDTGEMLQAPSVLYCSIFALEVRGSGTDPVAIPCKIPPSK
jgi:hypothetical protein